MSALFAKASDLILEIGQSSLRVAGGEMEIPLERSPNGLLTTGCREHVQKALRELNKPAGTRAIVALSARGLSLRRLKVPASAGENLDEVVALQVEGEFPLGPDQLAWGYCAFNSGGSHPTQEGRDVVVMAAKREIVEDYASLLSSCGFKPFFTPSAWAASESCRHRMDRCALLDVGRFHSELISYEGGIPNGLRTLPWGAEEITRELEKALSLDRERAEELKMRWGHGERPRGASPVVEKSIGSLAGEMKSLDPDTKILVTGGGSRMEGFIDLLQRQANLPCQALPLPAGQKSAAIARLLRGNAKNGHDPLLFIELRRERVALEQPRPSWKWAALAGLLLLAVLSLRYWEVFLKKPALARRVAEVKASWRSSPELDRNLSFFTYLETNRPPFLQTLEVVSSAAGGGTKIDSLSLDRRGDLSIKGTLPSSDQAVKFRDKLIESGWFTNVVFEEQTPMGNDRKLGMRMSARAQKPKATGESKEKKGENHAGPK